ncbi:uncharacterized protein LOC126907310 [Daktulosphaira vitifoliae]|uniref:uncharacterized protein LOC126907310 n=1 Tax=Daktulosphaira vitifoliae TaxID=58002 RepID=UPI0021A9A54F|nr:uncharacterized protein LOC126907310 [Daktulosphaira vitifoliae]
MYFPKLISICIYLLASNCYGIRVRREVHFPGYKYCGPGTTSERIRKNETAINGLDEACRYHDLVYDRTTALKHRVEADIRLENEAWSRVKAKDSSSWEKAAAWIVTNIMKMKRKLGTRLLRKNFNRTGRSDNEILDQRDPAWYNTLILY